MSFFLSKSFEACVDEVLEMCIKFRWKVVDVCGSVFLVDIVVCSVWDVTKWVEYFGDEIFRD